MSEPSEPTNLDDLLGPPSEHGVHEPFRRDLRHRTTLALRRRRTSRRIALTAALAACYLAGAVTMRLCTGSAASGERAVDDRSAHPIERPNPIVAPPPREPGPPKAATDNGTTVALQNATFLEQSQYERLRRLGDEFLEERGRVEIAMDWYSQALDVASEEELAIANADDTFLLAAMKRDRYRQMVKN
ncbi:MAG: hypothetical protein ACYTG0_17475 [Planctomycetota bacterium]|jgi:hypothetical protein